MAKSTGLGRIIRKVTVPAFAAWAGGIMTAVLVAVINAARFGLDVERIGYGAASENVSILGAVSVLLISTLLGAFGSFWIGKFFQRFTQKLNYHLLNGSSDASSAAHNIPFVELRRLRVSATRTVNRLRRENETLRKAAYTDARTGLATVLALEEAMQDALKEANFDAPMAYFLLDLDTLGQVTEQYGGATGEAFIVLAAQRLKATLQNIQGPDGAALRGLTLSSLPGGRFAICLPRAIDRDHVTKIARNIRQAFLPPLDVDGNSMMATISGGIVLAPQDAGTVLKLRRSAQLALDQVHSEAGSGFRYYSPRLNRIVRGKLLLEAELREGIANREFKTVFQPKIDFATGQISGAEALVRWRRDNGKIISPAAFIPLAEETGLINQIGEQVLEASCMSAKVWMREGFDLTVAVNVSPRQFLQGNNFTDTVLKILKRTGLPPEQLELEITENMAVADPSAVENVMRPLRAMGMKLAIDDFGTGHSNLSMLTQLPFDVFKIDRQFVSALETDRQAPAIVEMILAMAETLGLSTVAEGVETAQQADFLRRRGCATAQGFLYSKGLAHSAFMDLLRTWDPSVVIGPARKVG